MYIMLEQIDRPGQRYPLWKAFLPQQSVSQNTTFDAIQDYILGGTLGYAQTFQTKVAQRDGGIELTFAAEPEMISNLARVFEWLEKPYPYVR